MRSSAERREIEVGTPESTEWWFAEEPWCTWLIPELQDTFAGPGRGCSFFIIVVVNVLKGQILLPRTEGLPGIFVVRSFHTLARGKGLAQHSSKLGTPR